MLLRTADFYFSSELRRRANAVQFGAFRDAEWPAHCHAMPNHGACLSSASRDLSRCPLSRERSEEPAVLERRRWTWSVTLRASRLAHELDEPTSSVATQRHRLSSALRAFVCRVCAGSRAHLSQAWHARAQTHRRRRHGGAAASPSWRRRRTASSRSARPGRERAHHAPACARVPTRVRLSLGADRAVERAAPDRAARVGVARGLGAG